MVDCGRLNFRLSLRHGRRCHCRRASELAQTPAEIAYLSSRAEEYTTPG